jgi:HK97 family phage major capsid protein
MSMTIEKAEARIREIEQGSIGDPLRWPDAQNITPTARDHAAALAHVRNALSSQDGSAGGYTSPELTSAQITAIGLVEGSVMRRECTVLPGRALRENFPLIDDASGEGHVTGENTSATEFDATFKQRQSAGFGYRSGLLKAPDGLIQDVPTLGAALHLQGGRRVGRIQNRHFSVGTGSGQPQGILTGGDVAVTTASNSVIALSELIDLCFASLDSEYLANAALMLNPTLYATLSKLASADGALLWQTSALRNVRVVFNSHFPSSISAGTRMAVFADFRRGYFIRELGTEMRTYTDRFADLAQTAYETVQAADGFIADPDAIAVLKMAS